nr:CerR family C-terminal domain-containing protein [Desulfatitalea alkaliphila]
MEAGLAVFGRYGFEPSTTRAIARRAGVNMAAIPYYYDGKEGLYLAVVAHVAQRIEERMADTLAAVGALAAEGRPSGEAAPALLERLLGDLIDFMVGSSGAVRFARILLREQLHPSSAYETIFNRIMAPLIDAIARLLAVATGTTDMRRLRIRALSMIGQVMAFRVARESMVRMLDMAGYSADETEEIRRVVLEQTRFVLQGMGEKNASVSLG